MDASLASEASDDDDRRDGDADDGVDAAGDVSGVGWSAASGVASQALRGGDAVGPSSGQAAVGPAGQACARMARTAALEPKRKAAREALYVQARCPQPAGQRQSTPATASAPMRRRAPSLQAAALRAMVYAGLVPRTGLCARRDVPKGFNRLAALSAKTLRNRVLSSNAAAKRAWKSLARQLLAAKLLPGARSTAEQHILHQDRAVGSPLTA